MELNIAGQELNVSIPVACDQTGPENVELTFNLGIGENLNRISIADSNIKSDEVIQSQWSKVFIETIWNHVLTWIDSSTPDETYAGGFAIGDSGELITEVEVVSNQEVV